MPSTFMFIISDFPDDTAGNSKTSTIVIVSVVIVAVLGLLCVVALDWIWKKKRRGNSKNEKGK